MRSALLGNSTEHTLVDAQCMGRTFDSNDSALFHVDVLFFLMPFTVSASISTLSWTHLSHDNILHESLQWDEHLDASCVWYELSYCCELFFAATAFTGFLADGSTAVELYFVVLTVGGTLTLITASARFARATETEAVFALLLALICALVFGALFGNVVRISCVLCMLVALAFALHITIITMVHITARGERLASTIIAVRTLTSLISGYVLIVAYAVGKDKVCGEDEIRKQVVS